MIIYEKLSGLQPVLLCISLLLFWQQVFGEGVLSPSVNDDPALPRVLIIGDSISIGYTQTVRDELRGIANVHRVYCDKCSYPLNGGSTFRGLERLDEWLGDAGWDLIHFNWGLWDLAYLDDGRRRVLPEQYELNLQRLVSSLRRSNARLIWASITPIPEGKLNPPKRVPQDGILYNRIAEAVMKANGIPINDLYSFALLRLEQIQLPGDVHFSDNGYKVLGREVASRIKDALSK